MRKKLPADRESITRRFVLTWPNGDTFRFYVTVGLYEDGTPGEIFFSSDKTGQFASSMLRALAMAASIALQYGAPVEKIIQQWRGTSFPPEGFTGDEFRMCRSPLDLVAKWLTATFLVSIHKPSS